MPRQNFETEVVDKQNNDWKKVRLDSFRNYHMSLIKDLGIPVTDFNMKMPFYDKHGRYVVGIFGSEFKKDKGFFFELITRDLEPLEADRKVYRIARNDNFQEEYEINERGSFLVPVDELRVVNSQAVAISKESAVMSNDKFFNSVKTPQERVAPQPVFNSRIPQSATEDLPYSEMTIRDYMAIHTGRPVSLKPWLNNLISNQTPLPF